MTWIALVLVLMLFTTLFTGRYVLIYKGEGAATELSPVTYCSPSTWWVA